jgi:hypothetical protein
MESNFDESMSDEQLENVRQEFYSGDVNERGEILAELQSFGYMDVYDELEMWQEEQDLQFGADKDTYL